PEGHRPLAAADERTAGELQRGAGRHDGLRHRRRRSVVKPLLAADLADLGWTRALWEGRGRAGTVVGRFRTALAKPQRERVSCATGRRSLASRVARFGDTSGSAKGITAD